ncbi:response regulator [Flavobacterium capsici]|uniref:Response regulator n=1 Tax=Flavobacterium capsici TaxID=3075618 RepID=A0AA96EW71_9FLAO|nr:MULTISPECIES: response regulator [unclassified Flavobacterium]WNM17905.1 response regulator [Flavobacterium sp. PMR2A8]WNM21958.1 response regulator [Flavobacterium sp. PMTSA4]
MKKSQTIFYLDDDSEDLEFFKEIAEGLGHSVRGFSDGKAMLLVLESEQNKPDIIFLDVHMPVLNGQEILEIIKKSETLKDIPIVMVSGAYPKKLVKNLQDLGVNYLMKKHHIHDYRESVEELLNDHVLKSNNNSDSQSDGQSLTIFH